jgi:L-methionine (R)-S-oxide reductase
MAERTLVADRSGELRLTADEKHGRYAVALAQLRSLLAEEDDLLACMSSVVGVLHNAFPYYFWTGFYRRVGAEELIVGPYQGTVGCLRIRFDRGVCGAAARAGQTVIVPDVDRFPGHIACDARSRSEIVVPVLEASGEVIAVLDVDSSILAAFDEADRAGLERIVELLRGREYAAVWRSTDSASSP